MYLSVLIKKCTLASCKKGPRSWEERGGVGVRAFWESTEQRGTGRGLMSTG